MAQISLVSVGMLAGGSILIWSGFTGRKPTDVFKSLIQGTDPHAASTAAYQIDGSSGVQTISYVGGTSEGPGANKTLGRLLAAGYGWTGDQWDALVALWNSESGWSNTAKNPDSGAYGIPQAYPSSKLPAAGQASGGSDAKTQILWGLAYIKSRYGSPANAWKFKQEHGWY